MKFLVRQEGGETMFTGRTIYNKINWHRDNEKSSHVKMVFGLGYHRQDYLFSSCYATAL